MQRRRETKDFIACSIIPLVGTVRCDKPDGSIKRYMLDIYVTYVEKQKHREVTIDNFITLIALRKETVVATEATITTKKYSFSDGKNIASTLHSLTYRIGEQASFLCAKPSFRAALPSAYIAEYGDRCYMNEAANQTLWPL